MSKCPECGEEIDYLHNVESGDMDYRFNPDGSYESGDFMTDGGKNEYECPKCRKTLFTNETDAQEFLNPTIQIEVKNGTVTDVRNLPEGCKYEVIDHDLTEEGQQ